MAEVVAMLVKKKTHESTKYVALNRKTAALEYLYLSPATVRYLGNPDVLEIIIRPTTPNAAPAANGVDHAPETEAQTR